MGDLSLNFSRSEFACPCCGESKMNPEFMNRLQALRSEFGRRFRPVEGGGYRCAKYNGSETGAHVEGRAIDPDIPREHYHEFIGLAYKHGFTGIGLKQKDGRFQLHVDDADEIPGVRPRPWVWTY